MVVSDRVSISGSSTNRSGNHSGVPDTISLPVNSDGLVVSVVTGHSGSDSVLWHVVLGISIDISERVETACTGDSGDDGWEPFAAIVEFT